MYLIFLFSLLFFWEIGGQNIPNDWSDYDEDHQMNAKTIPIRWGLPIANNIILITISLTLGMSTIIFYFSQVSDGFLFVVLSLAVGGYLLLLPALKLNKSRQRSHAMALFNKASYYPLALLLIVLVKIIT
jgi:4-hydroxybenzoate polyprenyltransferase